MNITKWTKKDSYHRYAYSAVKQMRLTLYPIIIASFFTVFWYYRIWQSDIAFTMDDSEHLLLLTAPFLMLSLIFVGSFAYTKIDERKASIVANILKRNKNSFLLNRDERTSNVVLVFLASVALLLVLQAMFTHWESVFAGAFAVFVCSFVSAKFWALIIYLDDPIHSSRWISERVPQEWFGIDVDEYFELTSTQNKVNKTNGTIPKADIEN